MSEIKNKSSILTTIDKLRSRKSRPDLASICKFMLRFFQVTPKETKADLRRCVKEKSVYKVDYKGSVSYRNPARWRKNSILFKINKLNTERSSNNQNMESRITSTIASMMYSDQVLLEKGIPYEELLKELSQQSPHYSRKDLEQLVNREMISGNVVRLPNNNLALGQTEDGDSSDSYKDYNMDSNSKVPSSANSSTRSSPQRTRGRPRKRGGGSGTKFTNTSRHANIRVGERRKMAKKVFDPSDRPIANKKKRGRPLGSLNKSTIRKRLVSKDNDSNSDSDSTEGMDSVDNESGGVCSVCVLQQSKGSNDKLIECRDCSSKAHVSCLQSGPGILKLRPDSTWLCPQCKTCVVCCETNDAGVLTVCSVCSDAYHSLCHSPIIPERLKAWNQWKCYNCHKSNSNINDAAVTIQSMDKIDPFLKPHERDTESKSDEEIDETIPDIRDWTTSDVYEYFMEHFDEVAPVLREQDFDGQALSIASRSDIVKGLKLQLGPALKLYCMVVKLQTRKDDWTMCWG